jgi:hypothetical protein
MRNGGFREKAGARPQRGRAAARFVAGIRPVVTGAPLPGRAAGLYTSASFVAGSPRGGRPKTA